MTWNTIVGVLLIASSAFVAGLKAGHRLGIAARRCPRNKYVAAFCGVGLWGAP